MDLSKELKVMLFNKNEDKDALIENLIENQKVEQRKAEEKIHILKIARLIQSVELSDFTLLKTAGVNYIGVYIPQAGSNKWKEDSIRIKFCNSENRMIIIHTEKEELVKPFLELIERSGFKIFHHYTNGFYSLNFNVEDNKEDIKNKLIDALLAPHLKEIFKSNLMNVELENDLNVNQMTKHHKTKI